MKKKIVLLLPAFFLALSLGACQSKQKANTDANTGSLSGETGNEGGESENNGDEQGQGGEQGSGEQGSGEQGEGGEQGSGEQGEGEQGSGEQGQGGEETGQKTYTATGLPEWITNDGCVIFAWVWSPSDAGSWKSCTYGEAPVTELTFKVDEDLTGFLLARCIAGTTQPNWEEKGDVPGRVYNQTNDVECVAGTYSYAPEWK